MMREEARRGTRRRDRDTHAQSAIGGRAAKFLGDRLRVAEKTRQAAEIERDLTRTARFDARREVARNGQ
jgi:hypothetical protein